MTDDLLGSRDEIDQMLDSLPRTSRAVQDKIKGVEESMALLNSAITPYTDLAAKLKARDERFFSAINQLKLQNQTLLGKNETLTRDLSKANEDREVLGEQVSNLRKERSELQARVNVMGTENRMIDKKFKDAEEMLDTLRQSEVALTGKCSQLQAKQISMEARIGELQNRLESERQDYELTIEMNNREATKRMQDQKAEFDRRLAERVAEIQKQHVSKIKEMRADFDKAMEASKAQVKELNAKAWQYESMVRQMTKDRETAEKAYKAECIRRMEERYHQMMIDLQRDTAMSTRRPVMPPVVVNRMETVQNYPSIFRQDAAASSASDSARENTQHEPSRNIENVPPAASAGDGTRKRASSRGPSQPARKDTRYAAGTLVPTQRRINEPDAQYRLTRQQPPQ